MSKLRASEAPVVRPASDNHLAKVESVEDVGTTGRIEVSLLDYEGTATQKGKIKARVCAPFAGSDRGAFLIPDVGDEVLVSFIQGDPRNAVVLGSLWNGNARPKERLGGDGKSVDRWSLVGKKGTRIAIVEEASGTSIRLSISDSIYCELKDTGNGSIELSAGGSKLTIDQQGVTVETPGTLSTQASATQMTCATMDVSCAQSTFTGQVQALAVNTPSVIAASYTPGAGNVW